MCVTGHHGGQNVFSIKGNVLRCKSVFLLIANLQDHDLERLGGVPFGAEPILAFKLARLVVMRHDADVINRSLCFFVSPSATAPVGSRCARKHVCSRCLSADMAQTGLVVFVPLVALSCCR